MISASNFHNFLSTCVWFSLPLKAYVSFIASPTYQILNFCISKKINKEVIGFSLLGDAYMFSLGFLWNFKNVLHTNTYENVPHVEYEIQRRVLTWNVDNRPSTVNIYIYSGHIYLHRVHIKNGSNSDTYTSYILLAWLIEGVVPFSADAQCSQCCKSVQKIVAMQYTFKWKRNR